MENYLLQHLLKNPVEKHPRQTAIIDGRKQITYSQLEEKSNQIANLLIQSGLKPNVPVGIVMEKSLESIVLFLAILKTGAVYIPIDPNYSPLARIKNILKQGKIRWIVTSSKEWCSLIENKSENKHKLNLKCCVQINSILDRDALDIVVNDMVNELHYKFSFSKTLDYDIQLTASNLAYVLYTSGSTGIPKGVSISHQNALTFINWSLGRFNPNSTDVFSSFAPFHFDLSVFDIYVSLASGACLNIVPNNVSKNPMLLANWIKSNQLTIVYTVPSVWITMLNYASKNMEEINQLRYILFAGEVFPPKYLKALMKVIPDARYFNLYGPTETNVCTYHEVKDINEVADKPVPIGRACENTEAIAVDKTGQEIKPGETGELIVRGPIVTSGYYNDPEKTKNAFQTIEKRNSGKQQYYKTGDVVRLLENGLYEFIGREDDMVKVAGFRIELQEIEYALLSDQNISEVAVLAKKPADSALQPVINAFVTLKTPGNFSVLKVKKDLKSLLPHYMIPEGIEVLEKMPTNTNGKVDRARLLDMINN